MNKCVLVGVSIFTVVLIFLSSQTPVVGYRVVKESHQDLIQKTVNQVKNNLLTLKSLATDSRRTTGGIYTWLALVHFFLYFIVCFPALWLLTDHRTPYYAPILFCIIFLTLQFMSIFLFSTAVCLLLAAIWPLTDFIIYLLSSIIPDKVGVPD